MYLFLLLYTGNGDKSMFNTLVRIRYLGHTAQWAKRCARTQLTAVKCELLQLLEFLIQYAKLRLHVVEYRCLVALRRKTL